MSFDFPGAQLSRPAYTEDMAAAGQYSLPGGMTPGDALSGGLTQIDPATGLPRGVTDLAPGVSMRNPVDTPRISDQPQQTPFQGMPAPEIMPQPQFAQPQQMPQSQQQPAMPPAPPFPGFGTVIPAQTLPVVQQILNLPRLFGPAPGSSITQQQPLLRLPQMSQAQPQSMPYQLPRITQPVPRITQSRQIMRPGSSLRGLGRR